MSYTDDSGDTKTTYPLAPEYMGCEHPDPDHSFDGSRVSYDGGAMDGFLRARRSWRKPIRTGSSSTPPRPIAW